jgi:hypothetical protein
MSTRAISCTVEVGGVVYTFINRPHTDHIDYVKFTEKDPQNTAESGKIGTKGGQAISTQSGPLTCTKFSKGSKGENSDIRLYYVSNDFIREAKLSDVGPNIDLKSAWVVTENKTDDKASIMNLGFNARAIDQTSYMSSGRLSGPSVPYVVFQAAGEPDVFNYARASGTGDQMRWDSGPLPVKLVPS